MESQAVQAAVSRYSDEEHTTWSKLFETQTQLNESHAFGEWLAGAKMLKLDPNRIPQVRATSEKVQALSGWRVTETNNAFLNNEQWFAFLRNKVFPATNYIRKPYELDFTPYPDLFHEYFGHMPLMCTGRITALASLFAEAQYATPKEFENGVGRVWWHTMEFGFVRENGVEKAFGAGLLAGKSDMLDGVASEKLPFSLEETFCTLKTVDDVQEKYFILESVGQLEKALADYTEARRRGEPMPARIRGNFDHMEEIDKFNQLAREKGYENYAALKRDLAARNSLDKNSIHRPAA